MLKSSTKRTHSYATDTPEKGRSATEQTADLWGQLSTGGVHVQPFWDGSMLCAALWHGTYVEAGAAVAHIGHCYRPSRMVHLQNNIGPPSIMSDGVCICDGAWH